MTEISDRQQKVLDLLHEGWIIWGSSIGYGGKSTGARAHKPVPGSLFGQQEKVNEGAIKALVRKGLVEKIDKPGVSVPQYVLVKTKVKK